MRLKVTSDARQARVDRAEQVGGRSIEAVRPQPVLGAEVQDGEPREEPYITASACLAASTTSSAADEIRALPSVPSA